MLIKIRPAKYFFELGPLFHGLMSQRTPVQDLCCFGPCGVQWLQEEGLLLEINMYQKTDNTAAPFLSFHT